MYIDRRIPRFAEEHAIRFNRACLRLAIEDAIERLIAVLDDIDGDADCEPDGCLEEWVQPAGLRGGAHVAA